MEIKVPLSSFTAHLLKAKEYHWPHVDQAKWLCDNFAFDDDNATYQPRPESPYSAFTLALRN